MNRNSFLAIILLLAVSFVVCNASQCPAFNTAIREMVGKTHFLAVNMRADSVTKRISSVNYQLRGELIPWGTPVDVIQIYEDKMIFKDLESGKVYTYDFYWKTLKSSSLQKHLERILVQDLAVLKAKVNALSEKDKDGIFRGRVMPGMSKEGVLVAIGYPPEFATALPFRAREWQYWRSRWSKFAVVFGQDDKVLEIVGDY